MGQAFGLYGTIYREDPLCEAYKKIIKYTLENIKNQIQEKDNNNERIIIRDESPCR